MGAQTQRLFLLACSLLLGLASAFSFEKVEERVLQAKGLTFPLYSPASPQPTAIVRVGGFRTEFLRKGFFRIGALPVRVAEDVSVEIIDLAQATNLFVNMEALLRPGRADSAWSIRRFSIRRQGSGTPILSAGAARSLSGGKWELSGDVRIMAVSEEPAPRRALLKVAGPDAGQLEFVSAAEPFVVNVFASEIRSQKTP
jgi:hypothetical protein